MKYFIFTCVFALLYNSGFSQRKSIHKHQERTQNLKTADTILELTWKLKSNNYLGKNQFLSELTIKNLNKFQLNKDWALYFNFAPCRNLLNTAELENIKIEHINGDFFKMIPGNDFVDILPGDSMSIPIIASDWVTKETEVPCGFYFVFNREGSREQILIPEFRFYPFINNEQTLRSADDQIPVPDSESRYLKNLKLSLLPESMLNKIIPTPVFTKPLYSRLVLTSDFKIVYESELQQEAELLSAELAINLGKCPEIIKNQTNEKNNIFLKVAKLDIDGNSYGSEAYSIKILDGNVYIQGTDPIGVFYGIQSFKALLPVNSFKLPSEKIILDGIEIYDKPRFKYRGMHLDVARNFQPKASILKLLNIMAFYKMNKFHFHLSDDEGWRLEIPSIPELTEVGSKRGHTTDEKDMLIPSYGSGPFPDPAISSGTGYFSEQDFVEILKYATERHIEVIPEFDMPGHARAAIKSMIYRYVKYTLAGDKARAEAFLLSDPADISKYSSVQNFNDNVICVCQSSTYRFIETLIENVVQMYKKANAPLSTIHIGGDEVPHGVWDKSPNCNELKRQNYLLRNSLDLKEYFLRKVAEILQNRNLKTAGWEEIGMHSIFKEGEEIKEINPEFTGMDFLLYTWNSVYGWGGEETGYKLANEGYRVVLSNVSPLYLDMAYDKDPQEPGFYWGGYVDDEKIYSFDPYNVYSSLNTDLNGLPINKTELLNKTKLTEKGKNNIIGIQAQLWSETVKTPERMDYMIFPKLILVAERAWANQPQWITEPETYDDDWNRMMNTIGQKELPRMDNMKKNISYRIPVPGAIIINGVLYANTSIPGFEIRFTTDGTDPVLTSAKYSTPLKVNSEKIKLRCFTSSGRAGRIVTVP